MGPVEMLLGGPTTWDSNSRATLSGIIPFLVQHRAVQESKLACCGRTPATSQATCLTSPGLSVFLEGDLHDPEFHGLLGHDPGHVLDHLVLLPHLHRVRGRQQVQLVPPSLQGAGGDVHVLADVGGRPASVLLLDGPDPGLLGVVLVCHVGGVLGYFGVVVNTPRKLHSAGPTNRDYPT